MTSISPPADRHQHRHAERLETPPDRPHRHPWGPTGAERRRAGTAAATPHTYRDGRRKIPGHGNGGGRPPRLLTLDPIAVARAVDGTPPAALNALERRAVVAELTRRGHSCHDIARRLELSPRTVTRHRAATRTAAA